MSVNTEQVRGSELKRNANLDRLANLQKLDSEIARKKELLEKTLPEEIEELRSSFSNAKDALGQFEKELEDIAKERRDLEAAVEDTKVSIAKTKQKLPEVKTNVEYRAILKEQENLETKIIDLEDRQLELMESAESRSVERDALKAEADSEEKKYQSEKAIKEDAMATLKERLEALVSERKQTKEDVEPNVLAQYERVLGSRFGVGICQVVEGTCQACYQVIPPQLYYQIRTTEDIYQCPHCDRYLYHEPTEEEKEENSE